MRTLDRSTRIATLSDSAKGRKPNEHRYFVGGSDARIIMGNNEAALIRLWQEKRGEIEPQDLSGNLIVQLGLVTEELNRRWYQANAGQVLMDVQRQCQRHIEFDPGLSRSAVSI